MADASSIRKTTSPLAPALGSAGPVSGSLPGIPASGNAGQATAGGFYESAIRFQLNQPGYNFTYTDINGTTQTRKTGQAYICSGQQWVPVGNVYLQVGLPVTADDVDQYIFIADRPYNVSVVTEAHAAPATGACSVQISKCANTAGTLATPTAGVNVLTAAVDVHTPIAGVLTTGTLSATVANTQLATGDALGLHWTGTSTGLAGAVLSIVLQPA